MAHVEQNQIIVDGPRTVVYRVALLGDGSSSDFANKVIVQTNTFNPIPNRFRVKKVEAQFSVFAGKLEFYEATTPANSLTFLTIPEATFVSTQWGYFNGVPGTSAGNFNGEISISTQNLDQAGAQGTIIFTLDKMFTDD